MQREFDRLFSEPRFAIKPVTLEASSDRKGTLARVSDLPLLYKGRYFSHTDLQSVLKE